MSNLSRDIARMADWCPVMGGVRLREVSVEQNMYLMKYILKVNNYWVRFL